MLCLSILLFWRIHIYTHVNTNTQCGKTNINPTVQFPIKREIFVLGKMNQSDPLYYFPMKDVLSVIDANIQKYLPLELSPEDWSSLYIPYLNPSYTYNHLRFVLEERYAIGKVKTIHFVKNPSPSDKHKHDVSAFIHFEYWFNSDFALFLRYCLNQHEKYDISRYYKYFRFDARYSEDKNVPDRFHILINKSKNKHRGTTTYYPTQQPQVFDISDEKTEVNRRSWRIYLVLRIHPNKIRTPDIPTRNPKKNIWLNILPLI